METLHICIIALCMMPSTPYSPLCWSMCTDHLRYAGLHLKHISTNHSIFSHFLCKSKHQERIALPSPLSPHAETIQQHRVPLTADLRLSVT